MPKTLGSKKTPVGLSVVKDAGRLRNQIENAT